MNFPFYRTVVLFAFFVFFPISNTQAQKNSPPRNTNFVEGEYIIKIKTKATQSNLNKLLM